MIQRYVILAATILATTVQLQAQCGSCSTTISGANSANQLVSNGQTLCITPTGTLSGPVTILAGGKLCNQGTVNSSNIWIAGGVLVNYGSMNVNNLTVSSAGSFTNEATFDADSFLIFSPGARYVNNGTQINKAFATADHAVSVNNGTLTSNVIYDSIADFTNNGNVTVNDGFANGWGSTAINNGNISVTNDFANGYNSGFFNNKNMSVGRDFYNGSNSNYTTKCMVSVGRNWANSATILGPSASCGGFSIGGTSTNSGSVGNATSFVDLCDAGHPAGGIDANIGTLASTTTFCSCSNNCVTVGIFESQVAVDALSIYPNPANQIITIQFTSRAQETVSASVKDMMGRTVIHHIQASAPGSNEFQLQTAALAEGTYLLMITTGSSKVSTRMFTVAH